MRTESVAQRRIRQVLLGTIASQGGSLDADPRAVADAAVQAWIRAVSELAPVIGAQGVRALYGRCMALARSNYAWLPPGDFAVSQAKALANLRECLEGRKPTDAIEATTDSLVFLTELLGTMIGEALTMRLLNSAWGHDIPDQTKQELPK